MLKRIKYKGILQIILLKFRSVWILHSEVSEFEFHPLKFGHDWVLHTNISEFGFYPLKFGGV